MTHRRSNSGKRQELAQRLAHDRNGTGGLIRLGGEENPQKSGVTRLQVCSPLIAGFRVDDDGLRVVALPRQRFAGQLLERDLLRPTDVHDVVERLGGCRALDRGSNLLGGDRLDQRIEEPARPRRSSLDDRVGELGELGGVHDRVGDGGLGDDPLLGDLRLEIPALG